MRADSSGECAGRRHATFLIVLDRSGLQTDSGLADEVLEHLRAEGCRLAGIYTLAQDGKGRAVQADFWCERF